MAHLTITSVKETYPDRGVPTLKQALTLPIVTVRKEFKTKVTPLPFWEGGDVNNGILFPKVNREGVISGTVKILNVLQADIPVFLYFKGTGRLITSTRTNAIGYYEFRDVGLDATKSDYFAVPVPPDNYRTVVITSDPV